MGDVVCSLMGFGCCFVCAICLIGRRVVNSRIRASSQIRAKIQWARCLLGAHSTYLHSQGKMRTFLAYSVCDDVACQHPARANRGLILTQCIEIHHQTRRTFFATLFCYSTQTIHVPKYIVSEFRASHSVRFSHTAQPNRITLHERNAINAK